MAVIRVKYKGWKYIVDSSKPLKEGLQIEPPEKRVNPEFLYKYYSLSPYNIDALQNLYLYASHPYELNDKFDCLEYLIDLDSVEDDVIKSYFEKYDHTLKEIEDKIDYFREQFKIAFPISLFSSFGVISLTRNILNPLMWAHYASSNHGFAVKYNPKFFHEKVIGPFPINYQSEWLPIAFKVPILAFLYQTNIKSDVWKHEDEWRFIGAGKDMSTPRFMEQKEFVDNRKFSYRKEAVEEIILGNMFLDRINKFGENGTMVLALTPDAAYGKEKFELLNFIVENNIKTSMIRLKKGSSTFELDTQSVEIHKIDQYSFIMKEVWTE